MCTWLGYFNDTWGWYTAAARAHGRRRRDSQSAAAGHSGGALAELCFEEDGFRHACASVGLRCDGPAAAAAGGDTDGGGNHMAAAAAEAEAEGQPAEVTMSAQLRAAFASL
eukprot:COSAG01_NODE_19288_length_1019_cov_1.177174_1_plen_111_part_00